MLKSGVLCLYFAVVTFNLWNVNCITEEEKKAVMEAMKPMAEECGSECGLTEFDYKKHKSDQDDMDPCFKKCILQKMGLLTQDGKYDKDALHETISQFSGDKEKAQKVQDQLDSCFDTNGDNDGDDDESQMMRVNVLFKCLKEIKELRGNRRSGGGRRRGRYGGEELQ